MFKTGLTLNKSGECELFEISQRNNNKLMLIGLATIMIYIGKCMTKLMVGNIQSGLSHLNPDSRFNIMERFIENCIIKFTGH